mgnify:CR=1 FL=1
MKKIKTYADFKDARAGDQVEIYDMNGKCITPVCDSGKFCLPENELSDLKHNLLQTKHFDYIEVVSQAPRRPVTWEWVKDNIDELPELVIYFTDDVRKIVSANYKQFWMNMNNYPSFYGKSFYIDPPLPELIEIEISEPAQESSKPISQPQENGELFFPTPDQYEFIDANPEDAKEGDWLFFTDNKDKESRVFNKFSSYRDKDSYRFVSISGYPWKHAQRLAIRMTKQQTVVELNPAFDPEVPRLWWYKSPAGRERKTKECYSFKDFISRFHPAAYCPAEPVPQDGWVKV